MSLYWKINFAKFQGTKKIKESLKLIRETIYSLDYYQDPEFYTELCNIEDNLTRAIEPNVNKLIKDLEFKIRKREEDERIEKMAIKYSKVSEIEDAERWYINNMKWFKPMDKKPCRRMLKRPVKKEQLKKESVKPNKFLLYCLQFAILFFIYNFFISE